MVMVVHVLAAKAKRGRTREETERRIEQLAREALLDRDQNRR